MYGKKHITLAIAFFEKDTEIWELWLSRMRRTDLLFPQWKFLRQRNIIEPYLEKLTNHVASVDEPNNLLGGTASVKFS